MLTTIPPQLVLLFLCFSNVFWIHFDVYPEEVGVDIIFECFVSFNEVVRFSTQYERVDGKDCHALHFEENTTS